MLAGALCATNMAKAQLSVPDLRTTLVKLLLASKLQPVCGAFVLAPPSAVVRHTLSLPPASVCYCALQAQAHQSKQFF